MLDEPALMARTGHVRGAPATRSSPFRVCTWAAVAFDAEKPPAFEEALVVGWEGPEPLFVEVQRHIAERACALEGTLCCNTSGASVLMPTMSSHE
jgi:hypothetical protein